MIINQSPDSVEELGHVSGRVINSTIEITAKAFEVLTSKLYKDKIRAIVRELSCNAWDSHVEARNPAPFDVHLPTSFEPWFSIRDYGIGMTPETVENTMVHFFRSTKERTNDLIGALGLGAKSGFSYVDSFTLMTYRDGQRHTYNCYREHGLPKTRLVSSVASNEPVGVEITIPVKIEDTEKFAAAARHVYQWFETQPNILGKPLDIASLGNELRDRSWCVHQDGLIAVMGSVPYPIDSKLVAKHNLKNIAINFPIGDLDVQAGREELSYDPITIQNLDKRIAEVNNEIQELYRDDFLDCQNIFQACHIYQYGKRNSLYRNCPPEFRGISLVGNNITQIANRYGMSHSVIAGPNNPIRFEDYTKPVVFVDVDKKANARYLHFRKTDSRAGIRIKHSRRQPMVEFEGCDIIYSDDIVVPKKPISFRKIISSDIRNSPTVTVDASQDVIYILTKNLEWIDPDGEVWYRDEITKTAIVNLLKDHVGDATLAYIPWSMKGKIEPHWKTAYSVLDGAKLRHFLKKNDLDDLDLARRYYGLEKLYYGRNNPVNHFTKTRVPDTQFDRDLQLILKARECYSRYRDWVIVSHKTDPVPNDLRDLFDSFSDRFPMILVIISGMLDNQLRNIAISELPHYIAEKERNRL